MPSLQHVADCVQHFFTHIFLRRNQWQGQSKRAFAYVRLSRVKTTGKTGVEMEALTAVQVGLLTVYDMCKAIDKGMIMGPTYLVEKEGGKSGHFVRSFVCLLYTSRCV